MIAWERFPWGKYHQETGQTHRLEHHCADVAACFEVLLEEPVLRSRFARTFGESAGLDDVTVARLAVLTFLHDFGKVNAGFQFKTQEQVPSAPRAAGHIKEAVWACQRSDVIDALGLGRLARSWGPGPVEQLLCAALAHHGRPATLSNSSRSPSSIWCRHAGYDPIDACRRLHGCAHRWFPKAFETASRLPAFQPALPHLFAGTVALADQVGSNEELFPFQPEFDPQYIDVARARARSAVRKLGFARSDTAKRSPQASFQKLFDHESPRPLQRAVAEAPLDRPLLVLESETGSGKTEAAIWRFAKLWRAGLVDGLYFALPTRAAAVQLHRRVDRALKRVFPADADLGTVLAIPGYLRVGEATGWRVGKFEVKWRDDPDDEKRQARWSAESARKFLAATAAVGTVDQALLSGLMVKWAHFRGAALVRSLLVIDEVHASDAYMTEILRAVLRDHLDVGGYALLMSATLGCEAREALVSRRRRRAVASFSDAMSVPYPALTRVDRRWRCEVEPFRATGYSKSVTMRAESVLEHPQRIAKLALTEATRGARVLVVRNTVGAAQAVFSEVRELGGDHELLQLAGGPALHHSRFAAEDRKLLDGVVERALGRRDSSDGAEDRSGRGTIVVGTQTLEQSLDIDADVLIADLCPVDVLLQRMGRFAPAPVESSASRVRVSSLHRTRSSWRAGSARTGSVRAWNVQAWRRLPRSADSGVDS